MKKLIIFSTSVFMYALIHAQVYVDIDNTSGTYNGNSWATAYNNIQDGIDAAGSTEEVWVAEGTYYVYETGVTNTVRLYEGTYLYGGFAGTETSLSERDWVNHVTIIDGHQYAGSTIRVEHVVTALKEDADAFWNDGLIDGFTIQGGYSTAGGKGNSKATDPVSIMNSDGAGAGAGILIFQCSINVSNCIIQDNEAGKAGGIYVMVGTEFPTMSPNTAPTITNCVIQNNYALMRGGGMQCDVASHPTIINCKFLNNTCDAKGGGLYNDFGCSPTLTNCLFAFNTALVAGGMGNDGSSCPTLINCTVTKNYTTDVGAGVYTGSFGDGAPANTPTLLNCIVWGNQTTWGGPVDLRIWHTNYFFIDYSNIGSGFTSFGTGNIYSDPMFVDPAAGDFHLQEGSPCINTGTTSGAPADDLEGNTRDSNTDMGAYEYSGTSEINSVESLNGPLAVYPNPANETINIRLNSEQNETLTITDIYGREVKTVEINSSIQEINISGLKAGIYFIQTEHSGQTKIIKI